MECADCKRPLRTHRENLTDKPGTVRTAGRGLCITCYRRHEHQGTLDNYLPGTPGRAAAETAACLDCGRAIRPASSRREDYPDAVKGYNGYCYACNALNIQGCDNTRVELTKRTLSAYLAWRRPYRAKAGAL